MPTTQWPLDDPDATRRLLDLGVICGALTEISDIDPFTLRAAATRGHLLPELDGPVAYAAERIAKVADRTGASPEAVAAVAATVPVGADVADTAPTVRLLLAAPSAQQARTWLADPPWEAMSQRARALGWPDMAMRLLDDAATP